MRTLVLILYALLSLDAYAQSPRLQALITQHAERANVPVNYALAIAHVGSGFDPAHRAVHGGIGLMAVLPELAASTVEGSAAWLDEPVTNVSVAVRLLARLRAEHSDWQTVLSIYHSGKLSSAPATQCWVARVMRQANPALWRPRTPRLARCGELDLDDFGCAGREHDIGGRNRPERVSGCPERYE